MIKLLPCPYCKASWLFVSSYDYSKYGSLGYKGACKCGKFSKRVTWNPTKDQAVEEWNYIIEREGKGDAE